MKHAIFLKPNSLQLELNWNRYVALHHIYNANFTMENNSLWTFLIWKYSDITDIRIIFTVETNLTCECHECWGLESGKVPLGKPSATSSSCGCNGFGWFFIDDSKGDDGDNAMYFGQDLTIEKAIFLLGIEMVTGCKPIRKLDGSLDALRVAAPHLQAARNTHVWDTQQNYSQF